MPNVPLPRSAWHFVHKTSNPLSEAETAPNKPRVIKRDLFPIRCLRAVPKLAIIAQLRLLLDSEFVLDLTEQVWVPSVCEVDALVSGVVPLSAEQHVRSFGTHPGQVFLLADEAQDLSADRGLSAHGRQDEGQSPGVVAGNSVPDETPRLLMAIQRTWPLNMVLLLTRPRLPLHGPNLVNLILYHTFLNEHHLAHHKHLPLVSG